MTQPDFCTRAGAERLKQRIEAYWRARGADVSVSLARCQPGMFEKRVDLRSDMRNGYPAGFGAAEERGR